MAYLASLDEPVAAQKSIWSPVKIATEEILSAERNVGPAVLCYPYMDAGRYGTRASAVVRSYRPRRNGHAYTVAKEFTRRGALPPQHGELMSKDDELKFEGGAATKMLDKQLGKRRLFVEHAGNSRRLSKCAAGFRLDTPRRKNRRLPGWR
jgi:hypothetical protein